MSAETSQAPSRERQEQFVAAGWQLDQNGRPLHPWINEPGMELSEETPLWQWGENAAADAIVFNTDAPEVLLIKRPDGSWANAGGFVDASDSDKAHAAAREAYEEEGLRLYPAEALPVFEGIVHDKRASKYSWITTAAFLWRTSLQLDKLEAGDDAQGIKLLNLADVQEQSLSGSHNMLIEQAVQKYGTLLEKLHYYQSVRINSPTAGGHMAYDRYISELPTGELAFIKQYSPHKYTDRERANRSMLYLQKEAYIYQYLRLNGFDALPASTGYHDGMLAMAALTEGDDWNWRHPQDALSQKQYIADTINALRTLSDVPIPEGDAIKPSFISFDEEGWGTYDDDNKKAIVAKLNNYACVVTNDNLSDSAYKLAANLDNLYANYKLTDYDQSMVMCHHDVRESNLAWHPQQGTKIIDWSWAGAGLKNSDTTTFLIDLHKRGVDVSAYMSNFNKDHALMMIGFWLTHSTWPEGDTDVRFQQVHSAVAAYELLKATA